MDTAAAGMNSAAAGMNNAADGINNAAGYITQAAGITSQTSSSITDSLIPALQNAGTQFSQVGDQSATSLQDTDSRQRRHLLMQIPRSVLPDRQ